MFDVLPATWDTLCVKLQTHNLCMTSALNRGPNPVHVIFFFFFFQHTPICKSRQFATVCTYPQIVDRRRLQCCPWSNGGVSEYVLG